MKLDDVKVVLQLAQESLKGVGFFPGVEAIASVPLKLIEYYETVTANKKELDDLISALVSLQKAVILPLEAARARGHRYVPEMRERVNRLCDALVAMESKLGSFVGLGRWRSFLKKDAISDVLQEVNRDLSHSISQFQLGGQISVEFQIWEMAAGRLLDTLHPANARFDASEKQPCLPNTRSALLSTIRDHIHSPSHSFVCLYGSPGTGKSAVAKSIATELYGDNRLAASYFFDKRGGAGGNASLSAFVSTLVYQLARYDFDFDTALSRQLKRDPLLAGAAVEVRLRELLLQPLRSISWGPKPRRRWIIVIDALDECGDSDHQEQLVGLLHNCADVGNQLVFFLTSRPEATITRGLQNGMVDDRVVVESMDEQDRMGTDDDIEAFVNTRLSNMRSASRTLYVPIPADVKEFAVLCGGLFEIAAVRLRQMTPIAKRVPLRKVFADALRTARRSSSSRSPLQEAYIEILTTAYEFSDDPDQREAMLGLHRSIVGALTALRQPLTLSALAALVDIEADEARMFLEPLASVIAVPDDDRPVHVYHTSFLEFLTSNPGPESLAKVPLKDYVVDSVHCNVSLAKRGLTIMNELLGQNILGLADPSPLNDDIQNLTEALAERVPDYLRYACLHWADHLRDEDTSECCDLLVSWCYDKIMFYLETLSLVGDLERAVSQLLKARDWIAKIREMEAFNDILGDSCRLAQTFHPVISRSAGSIYSCAIPFMPSCTLVPIYSHHAVKELEILYGRPTTWSPLLWALQGPAPDQTLLDADPKVPWAISYLPNGMLYSPDGTRIVTGLADGLLRTISTRTGQLDDDLRVGWGRATCASFICDGKGLISGWSDGYIRIWSRITKRREGSEKDERLNVHRISSMRPLALSPDGNSVVGYESGGITERGTPLSLWSVATGTLVRVFELRSGQPINGARSVAFSPASTHVACITTDGLVAVWSVMTGELKCIFNDGARARSISLSPDGKRIAAGFSDGSTRIWFIEDGRREWLMTGSKNNVDCVAFSWDGKRVASGSRDRLVRIWSVADGVLEGVLQGQGNPLSVAFSPNGVEIASEMDDGMLCAWSITAAAQLHAARRRIDANYHLNLSPTRTSNAARPDSSSQPSLFYDTGVRAIAVSLDGRHIVSGSGSDDCIVRLWSVTTGRLECALVGHIGGINAVAISSSGTRIVSGSDDRTVRIWCATSGKLERALRGHDDSVTGVALSPDNSLIASGGRDDKVRLWTMVTGELIVVCETRAPKHVAFSPGGDGVRWVTGESALRMWSIVLRRDVPVRDGDVWWASDRELRSTPATGWMLIRGRLFWLPPYLRGQWALTAEGVVIRSEERKRLVILRVRPKNWDSESHCILLSKFGHFGST